MPPPRFLWFMLRSMGRVLGRRLLGRPKDPRWPFVFEMIVETLGQVSDYTLELPVAEARAFQESLAQPLTLPVRRETQALAGVEAELFLSAPRAPVRRAPGAILYLHGGSYLVGSSRTHAAIIGRLALSGVPVWALNYEHAPERSLAEIRDQALAAYQALRERTEGPIALAGDSAGGGLCLLLMLALRERGEPQPAGAALIAPWVDMRSCSASHEENGRWDWGTGAMLRRHAEQVAGGEAIEGPLYVPLQADLSGLPPILIHAGELELQRDDSLSLFERLKEAGVEAEIKVWPAMVHDFHLFADQLPLAEEANEELRAFLGRRLESAPG